MMSFKTVEEAYAVLGAAAIEFPKGRPWDSIYGKYVILNKMVSASWGLEKDGVIDEKGPSPQGDLCDNSMDAALHLSEDLLRTTGHRIWGLTFTLFPTGKIRIEYDYNKPEGYEETDEPINLDDAVGSLQNILAGGSKAKE